MSLKSCLGISSYNLPRWMLRMLPLKCSADFSGLRKSGSQWSRSSQGFKVAPCMPCSAPFTSVDLQSSLFIFWFCIHGSQSQETAKKVKASLMAAMVDVQDIAHHQYLWQKDCSVGLFLYSSLGGLGSLH